MTLGWIASTGVQSPPTAMTLLPIKKNHSLLKTSSLNKIHLLALTRFGGIIILYNPQLPYWHSPLSVLTIAATWLHLEFIM